MYHYEGFPRHDPCSFITARSLAHLLQPETDRNKITHHIISDKLHFAQFFTSPQINRTTGTTLLFSRQAFSLDKAIRDSFANCSCHTLDRQVSHTALSDTPLLRLDT
ncbi:hypothetical protein EYB26_006498 [Talaromyces marneffei]|uniref:uncharacterized protein n=1 Tax=Talaromyces marneffei TaxID=37727 RepID=UPI0012AA184A|nr:uncharacterized protein EYB26_006498 [Talaromyces marneffei]QGA18813.1 hypothetical protein EYB26_006498 [Talaromyces marneffei]